MQNKVLAQSYVCDQAATLLYTLVTNAYVEVSHPSDLVRQYSTSHSNSMHNNILIGPKMHHMKVQVRT